MNKKIFIVTCMCIMNSCVMGVSFVYNLRIAEITRRQAVKSVYAKPSIGVLNLINQNRKRTDHIRENVCGALASYIWVGEKAYFKIDTAYANVRQQKPDSFFSCSEPDDILFSVGYNWYLTDRFRYTISAKLGIPTHDDNIVRGLQFGTGHVGLGGQFDCAVTLSQDRHNNIFAAARYIRYFPSIIFFPKNPKSYVFNIGNLVDLLVAYNTGFDTNRFEFGYNSSIVFFPTIEPHLETPLNQRYGVRSNFYGAFTKLFRIRHHLSGIITGFSYGFDNVPKLFKRIISFWFAWGINF